MTDVLDKHNIRCCASLNMAVLEHFPEIGEAMVQRNYDFMSHGIYNTRYLNSYTEEQEREFYRVNSGKLVSVPYSIELNDAPLFRQHYEGDYFAEICKAQFDQLYEEGAHSRRVICIALHPWLIGQPFRIGYLDRALGRMMRRGGVWAATGSEIVGWFRNNPPTA